MPRKASNKASALLANSLACLAVVAAVVAVLGWHPGIFWVHVPPRWLWWLSAVGLPFVSVVGGIASVFAVFFRRSLSAIVSLLVCVAALLLYSFMLTHV